jgi:OFA family oxalate/formate antiporter-like MFS transporter
MLIPAVGIRATIGMIAVLCAVLLCLSIFFGRVPGPNDRLPAVPPRKENKAGRDYSAVKMMRTPLFWVIFVYCTITFSMGLVFLDHAAGVAMAYGAPALLGLLLSPAKGVACIFSGWIMDRLGIFGGMLLCGGCLFVASLILLFGNAVMSPLLILFGLVLIGFGFGASSSVRVTATRFLFGDLYYSQNYSVSSGSILFSSAICYLGGRLVANANGSYLGIFYLTLIASAIAVLVTFLYSYFLKKRENLEAQTLRPHDQMA